MQQIVIYWYSIVSQHVSGIFMPIIRICDCVPLPIVVCPVVAVVMLTKLGNILHTVHTSCHPTLQHHNSYRQWNAVGSPDDGYKDARNMLRYY